jgi:hypothetical protein
MILFETARSIHFGLCQDLKLVTADTERLGTTGASLYYCDNFTSPIHCDRDAARGFSAQYEVWAEPKAYSFIYVQSGLYFITQANSFW